MPSSTDPARRPARQSRPREPRREPSKRSRPSGTIQGRNTANYLKLVRLFRADCARKQKPCWLCRQPIDYALHWSEPYAYSTDHIKPLSRFPELAEEITNFAPAHRLCNLSRGNRDVLDLGTPSRDW